MISAWSQSYRLTVGLIIVVGVFTGCASLVRDLDDRMNRMQFKSDYASFENALSVYQNGDYEQAMDLFRTLSAAKTHEKLARKARLGEICCRLMLAVTPSDYAATIALWQDFSRSVPANDEVWDMDLINPLIVHLTPKRTIRVIEIDPSAAQISAETPASAGLRQGNQQENDKQVPPEFSALEKKSAQTVQLQRRLEAVIAENRSLKEKIKALEAIDQNIQKKKTEMAAPSE